MLCFISVSLGLGQWWVVNRTGSNRSGSGVQTNGEAVTKKGEALIGRISATCNAP